VLQTEAEVKVQASTPAAAEYPELAPPAAVPVEDDKLSVESSTPSAPRPREGDEHLAVRPADHRHQRAEGSAAKGDQRGGADQRAESRSPALHRKKVYFSKGHGEHRVADNTERGLKQFVDNLKSEATRPTRSSSAAKEMPADAQALVIAGPSAASPKER